MSEYTPIGLSGLNGVIIVTRGYEELLNKSEYLEKEIMSLNIGENYNDLHLIEGLSSATIEGARTTIDKVSNYIATGNGGKDELMVSNMINSIRACQFYEITLDNIKVIWNLITKNVCENKASQGYMFRDKQVYISNGIEIAHTPAEPEDISIFVDNLINYLNSE